MRIRAITAVGLLTAGTLSLLAGPAAAHESRKLGDLELEVGFADEPAYTGQPNAAIILIAHDGRPVMNLEGMTVTITTGDETSEAMDLVPGFVVEDGKIESGTPGEYHAPFVPTAAGTYTFHFVGTVDGEDVDEGFTSGPKTFDDVQSLGDATFPRTTAPSNDELAARIGQESARTADAVHAAAVAAADAQDAAGSARTFGIIGIVVGALGLVVALVAMRSNGKARG
jgi:hypothetical protein